MRALLDEVRHESPRLDTYTGRLVFREPSAPQRVGYALGLWGGVSALNELSSDPYVRAPALQGALLGALYFTWQQLRKHQDGPLRFK